MTIPLRLSPIVSGMMHLAAWGLSAVERVEWVKSAVELGITTFDHADIYGDYQCETLFGEVLAAEPGLRDHIQLITKCGIALQSPNRPAHVVKHYNTTTEHILASVARSLQNLQTDTIDVLLIHRPDPLMNADAVMQAFRQLHEAGTVRHFGVSNFTPAQIDLLQSQLNAPLVTNQIQFSALHRQPLHDGTLDHAQQHHYRPMAWSPLAGGRIFTGGDHTANRVRDAIHTIAEQHTASPDQVALAWLMMHPTRPIPVLGTGKLHRLRSAWAALDLTLTRQQWFRIWQASAGHEVP
jgi:predicted oxidoreductase